MYIIYKEVSETTGEVDGVIFIPSADDRAKTGRDIDNSAMVYPVNIPGMVSRLMINLETNELYYDYYVPETVESKITELEKENGALRQAVAELTVLVATPQA